MRKLILFSTTLFISICGVCFAQTKPTNTDTTGILPNISYKQNGNWVEHFRQFRDALYQRDKSKAKAFLDLPFKNGGNDIWYLAYSGNEKAVEQLSDETKPLTEKDFNKYFNEIFPDQFIKCLLKIKVDELYKKGKTESPPLKDSATTYKLYATYNKKGRTIDLNLAMNTPYKISATEYESGETSHIYRFTILKNGHIKFITLLIVG